MENSNIDANPIPESSRVDYMNSMETPGSQDHTWLAMFVGLATVTLSASVTLGMILVSHSNIIFRMNQTSELMVATSGLVVAYAAAAASFQDLKRTQEAVFVKDIIQTQKWQWIVSNGTVLLLSSIVILSFAYVIKFREWASILIVLMSTHYIFSSVITRGYSWILTQLALFLRF
ncbi:hypothetical protein OXX80_004569 [Metschnikowia pulcherrima]